MISKFLGASVLAVIASTSIAHAGCLKDSDVKRHKPDPDAHVEELGQKDGTIVSIHRQQGGKRFVEVIRSNRCIISVKVLGSEDLSAKYKIFADDWDERGIAQEEALDNEGMPEGSDSDFANAADLMFPFLALDKYQVPKIYDGPIRRPDFNGRDRNFADFRTLISSQMKKGANFSGQYVITEIGCGTGCSIAILSDLKTGQQYKFPRGGEEAGPITLKYKAGSSLLIATWRDGAQCVLEPMLFDGQKWATLMKASVGDADACYEDIDQNIKTYKANVFSKSDPADVGEPAAHSPASVPSADAKSTEKPSVLEPGQFGGFTEYDNISVAALLELYEAYEGVRACYLARENQSPAYLSKSEMARADAALKQNEAEILRRNPGIDKQAVAQKAADANKLFTSIIIINGKIKMNYEHSKACRTLASLFPPRIENAVLRKRENIGKPNTASGLIVPQNSR